MASANNGTVTVTVTRTVTEDVDGVTLHLTPNEAASLLAVTAFVGGRGHITAIGDALRDAGVDDVWRRGDHGLTRMGGIHFGDLPAGDPARDGLRADPFADVVDDADPYA